MPQAQLRVACEGAVERRLQVTVIGAGVVLFELDGRDDALNGSVLEVGSEVGVV